MKAIAFILVSVLLSLSLAVPSDATDATNPVRIHIIPHSHDDMGWLKTVDQYYYNARQDIAQDGVQYILDTVTRSLNANITRNFVYCEIGFFERWWNEQTISNQAAFTKLVNLGQLEFVNGGYVMNDEAAVYYEDSIEQMTMGHQFLLKTFGVTPTTGWHLDPFGHAAAQASLFAQMGFNSFFIGRIDHQDEDLRKNTSNMEMVWIPQTSQGNENGILTHVLFRRYSNPDGFCFDIRCSDVPVMDDVRLEGFNADQRAKDFATYFSNLTAAYKSTTYLHTAGDDFQYTAAQVVYKNYDKLFTYLSNNIANYSINVTYSTPSKYVQAVYPLNLVYPTKTDDFFPYSDYDNAYWGGYFTSRVALKGLIRKQGAFLQATRRLISQATWQQSSSFVVNNKALIDKNLRVLEEALSIGQHHDAVTGTSKQAVAEDYKRYFGAGEYAVKQNVLYPLLQERVLKDLSLNGLNFSTCQLNTSSNFCSATASLLQNTSVLVSVYNSATARTSTIRVKVPGGKVVVHNSTGGVIPTDIICSNLTDVTDCDLFFTDNLNPFAFSYYYLIPTTYPTNEVRPYNLSLTGSYAINNATSISAQDWQSYTIQTCTDGTKANCTNIYFNLNYSYYPSYQDSANISGQTSGAYIFRPITANINGPSVYDVPNNASIYLGKNLIQISLNGSKILTNMRIYNDISLGVEVQTFVNSIDTSDGQGKEVVMLVQRPNLNNSKVFYTDSMGMELQKRVINFRPTWNLTVSQPVAGNYYPVQSTILINDTKTNHTLAIVPDRAEGGTSIVNGQVELMLHRRLVQDDGRGVGEPLNELDWDGKGMRQWITHTIVFGAPGFVNPNYRAVQLNRDNINLVVLAPNNNTKYATSSIPSQSLTDNFGNFDPLVKLVARVLPQDVATQDKYVFRFHNLDDVNSKNISSTVFVNTLYKGVLNVTEMSLTYNQNKTTMVANKLNWNNLGLNNASIANNDYLKNVTFLLRPLEIRTFLISGSLSSEAVEI